MSETPPKPIHFQIQSYLPAKAPYQVAVVLLGTGENAILKTGLTAQEVRHQALWYQQNSAENLKLIRSNEEKGALLLEKANPGLHLKTLVQTQQDDMATEIIARCILSLSKISKELPLDLRKVSSLEKDLEVFGGRVEKRFIDWAHGFFREFTADSSKDQLLHGDIHHDNILSHQKGWALIDPHCYQGPAAFEVTALIRNPVDAFPENRSLKQVIQRRLEILPVELPFHPDEIKGWAFVGTLLSLAWSYEDEKVLPKRSLGIIELLWDLP